MYWQKTVYRGILAAGVLLALHTGFTQAAPITIEEQGSFTVGGSYNEYKIGSENVGEDKWGTEYAMAQQFVETINRHGGDATLVHLPDVGIKGNSHFLMQEKNNREILDPIVGTGSVVTKDVPDNAVVVGVPAKIVKTIE